MAEAFEVYLDKRDNFTISFEQASELQPLVTQSPEQEMASSENPQNSDAENMSRSVGQPRLSVDKFVNQYISDRSKQGGAKALLSYLVYSVDTSTLRFTQDGQVFFQGVNVPDAHLATILQSLITKRQKHLVTGEYCLLMCWGEAPDYIKKQIHPSKLKLCNIHMSHPTPPKHYPARPPKSSLGPVGRLQPTSKIKIVGAAPYPLREQPRHLLKNPPLDRSRPVPPEQKKKLNVYRKEQAKPWYTL